MKRNIKLSIIGWLLGCIGGLNVEAQTVDIVGSDDNKKETQEIIIRKKGDKDTKFTMEITSNKILINGKPLAEFSENGLTINNRKIITREGGNVSIDLRRMEDGMQRDMMEFEKNLEGMNPNDISSINIFGGKENNSGKPHVFLGVTTMDDAMGAKITSIVPDSPAEKAGLQKDDIITKINDSKIEVASSLSEIIKNFKKEDKIKVYYKRDNKEKNTTATLSETKEGSMSKTMTIITKDGKTKSLIIPEKPRAPLFPRMDFDDNFESIYNFGRPKLGLKIQDTEEGNGVKVLEVESASASATAGLLKDDLITEIGTVKVQNTDDARKQLQENRDKNSYTIKANRNGNEMTFNIKIPKKLKTANL